MADYKVSDASLIAVADAIREKGGTAAELTFPAGFVSAIGAISGDSSPHVYGVSWPVSDGKLTASVGTRTDEAEDFSDPVPSVGGAVGSSPYDDLQPWAGMVVSQDQLAGALVAIPRFWYKWTQTASTLKLQIATGPVAGFSVAPAHADRGDGKGEREVVYIARYKCAGQMGVSVSGEAPVTSVPRYFIRTLCQYGSELGGTTVVPSEYGIYQQDIAMFWTVRLLMLVEYADWKLQEVLGYGCGTGSDQVVTCPTCEGSGEVHEYETCPTCGGTGEIADEPCENCGGTGQVDTGNTETCSECSGTGQITVTGGQEAPLDTGTTDDMSYHTGTVQEALDIYGQGIQYRHIEDLWAGCFEWLDGYCVNTDADSWEDRNMYLQMNPKHYAEIPYALEKVMDDESAEWAEWCAARVDLANGSFDGDDPSDYFDAATMQSIAGYCIQQSSDYLPEYGNLGGKVSVCVDIMDTRIFRKRISYYSFDGSTLYARTGWFCMAGQKVRGVLDLNAGSMWAEDENGTNVMDKDGLFMALIGSSTIGGVMIGKVVSGWIGGWTFPENAGLSWFGIPVTDGVGSDDSKVADRCWLAYPALACGALWLPDSAYGPFYLSSLDAGFADSYVGARLQKLP